MLFRKNIRNYLSNIGKIKKFYIKITKCRFRNVEYLNLCIKYKDIRETRNKKGDIINVYSQGVWRILNVKILLCEENQMKRMLMLLFVLCLLLVSCTTDSEIESVISGEVSTDLHLCSFVPVWSFDNANHWHECEDENCAEISEKTTHIWDSGMVVSEATESTVGLIKYTCTVCAKTDTKIIPIVQAKKKYIAITFDDAPAAGMENIIDMFSEYGAKATFFVVGNFINENNTDVLRYAIDMGFEIGNHTQAHGKLNGLTSVEDIKERLTPVNERFLNEFGYEIKVARAPELAVNDLVLQAGAELGMPFISRVVGTQNWYNGDCSNAVDGGIYLFHVNSNDIAIMPDVLAELTEQGYEFVTVSELFEIKGYESVPLGVHYERVNPQ